MGLIRARRRRGGRPLDQALEDGEHEADAAGRVHLLGKVPHAGIETLMQAADLFVSASRAESCGFAALEAMACGAVPVLSDIPSFRALTGDAMAHAILPGAAIGYLIAGLSLGAMTAGGLIAGFVVAVASGAVAR